MMDSGQTKPRVAGEGGGQGDEGSSKLRLHREFAISICRERGRVRG